MERERETKIGLRQVKINRRKITLRDSINFVWINLILKIDGWKGVI